MTPHPNEDFAEWFERCDFQHFKADELEWYFSKVRNGVRNTEPPRGLWENIVKPLRILTVLRHHFGKPITINSTYRALPYNRAIGSPDGSMHVKFNAIDFAVQGVSPSEVARVLKLWRSQGIFTGGIGTYRTFVHLDTRSRNATW